MFGIDKDKIKRAFADFTAELATLPQSSDPVVRLVVKFILALSEAFS
jgi:hypothetical protein